MCGPVSTGASVYSGVVLVVLVMVRSSLSASVVETRIRTANWLGVMAFPLVCSWDSA